MRLADREFKGGFNTKNLFYLSVGWLSKDGFGQARLTREVTDAWIQRKFKHGGQEYTTEAPDLSPQEIEGIPGGKASLGQLDEVKFEVLERTGDKMTIKADEHKYWMSQTGQILETYEALRTKHQELIGQQNSPPPPTHVEETPETPDTASRSDVTIESVAKLEESIGVEAKCASEINGVDLLLCKDKSVWIVANQEKNVPKHALLGGFGTGQWVADSDAEPGVSFQLDQGDKTIIQLDESSFSSESQGISTLSLFKLLVRAEREKGLTEYRLSFLKVERKQDNAVEAGQDGFEIKIKNAMKFRCMKDPRASAEANSEKVSCKNFFSKALGCIRDSDYIMKLFRYRFERVGQNFKVQRPYVVASKGISLKKDAPLKVASNTV